MKTDRDVIILDRINHFAVNGLDDAEVKILRDAISKIDKKRNVSFERSLSRAYKIVASWPKWKQDAIGSLRVENR